MVEDCKPEQSTSTGRDLLRILRYVRRYWAAYAATIALGLIKMLSPVPTFLGTIIGAKATHRVIRDIRCDLYAHVQKLSHSFYDINRSGSLTSRIISDVQAVQPFLNQTLVQFWINIGLVAVILTYFFRNSVILGGLSLVLIPLHVLVVRTIGRRVKALAREIRAKLAWISGNTQEKLAAATVVKAYTHEEDEIQKFTDDNDTLVGMGVRTAKLSRLPFWMEARSSSSARTTA